MMSSTHAPDTPIMADDILIAYVTCPDDETAENIATALIDHNEAACVNIVPNLRSVYRWEGHVEIDNELLLLIKTTVASIENVRARVLALHPDELPEVIAVPVTHGLPAYLDWVREETADR